MTRYIAFLRAVNVGGHGSVKMADLKHAFTAAACGNVNTYIQSGNVLFESPETDTAALFQRVRIQLRMLLGSEPVVIFRKVRDIERIVREDPFKEFEGERGVAFYVVFLNRKPRKRAEPSFDLFQGSVRGGGGKESRCFRGQPPEDKRILRLSESVPGERVGG